MTQKCVHGTFYLYCTDSSPTRVCWSGPPPASTARPRSHPQGPRHVVHLELERETGYSSLDTMKMIYFKLIQCSSQLQTHLNYRATATALHFNNKTKNGSPRQTHLSLYIEVWLFSVEVCSQQCGHQVIELNPSWPDHNDHKNTIILLHSLQQYTGCPTILAPLCFLTFSRALEHIQRNF